MWAFKSVKKGKLGIMWSTNKNLNLLFLLLNWWSYEHIKIMFLKTKNLGLVCLRIIGTATRQKSTPKQQNKGRAKNCAYGRCENSFSDPYPKQRLVMFRIMQSLKRTNNRDFKQHNVLIERPTGSVNWKFWRHKAQKVNWIQNSI